MLCPEAHNASVMLSIHTQAFSSASRTKLLTPTELSSHYLTLLSLLVCFIFLFFFRTAAFKQQDSTRLGAELLS